LYAVIMLRLAMVQWERTYPRKIAVRFEQASSLSESLSRTAFSTADLDKLDPPLEANGIRSNGEETDHKSKSKLRQSLPTPCFSRGLPLSARLPSWSSLEAWR